MSAFDNGETSHEESTVEQTQGEVETPKGPQNKENKTPTEPPLDTRALIENALKKYDRGS